MQVCVFCAASNRVAAHHLETAAVIGRFLAEAGMTLVYGGGNVGLMGAAATAAHEHGGQIIGIIPERLMEREVAYKAADELIITKDMLSRKRELMDRSDVFVTLAGGFGTLDELLEVVTHRQLGYHDKPILVLNSEGIFDPFKTLLEHLNNEGFIHGDLEQLLEWFDDEQALMNHLNQLSLSQAIN